MGSRPAKQETSRNGYDLDLIKFIESQLQCDIVANWVEQKAQVAGCHSTSSADTYLGRKRKRENEGKWGLDLLSKKLQGMGMIWT
ncbi:hypothetical protein Bca52824_086463 [Brassica carinata]|uniref:Uncharacterized protein n=1 Tax=Brassica carinata TaxID=52824 RepID=A0A8X7P8U6_BRACI|nr:hypothetical protein Bca52824_086463 [Brassica carinata]